MHRFTLLFLTVCLWLPAAAVPLTFRVDMRGQTVDPAGVRVAGDFQAAAGFPGNWNPATTALTDPDGDSIYAVTVQVPTGTYLYKFVNGTTWGGAEAVTTDCGLADGGGNVNRQVSVGASVVQLPVIPFGGCLTTVQLAVDMRGQTVARGGVFVVGNFQALAGYDTDWDPAATPLTDPDRDGIYAALISLPAPGRFQYRFLNGPAWSGAEAVPAACGVLDATGALSRVLEATASNTALPALCFASCAPCSGIPPTTYATHWWNDAVFYEIFVRSFYDTNGNGIGDFAGLTAKLDYLNDGNPATTTDLGITGIWLMPMMQSPSYHGYDVTNYKATEPDYGSMIEFEAFLAAAHARGIKVIIDLVLNHSSNQHPWFAQASTPTNARRDWFRWSTTNPGTLGPWGQTVWHQRNGAWYYGIFYSGMPDLNWSNPDLKAAMWDASRFWLAKGVDGYRLDAIKYLDEDGTVLENTPETFSLLEEFHDSVRAVNPNAFTVGEAWSNTASVVPYVLNDRLDACFEFDLANQILNAVSNGNAAALRAQLNLVNTAYPTLQYATFLTNHDQNRVLDQLNGNMARMKQAAALYLTLPGVPFLYYGEEVGMSGTGPDEDKRLPMQWTAGPRAGFTTGNPWRAPNANYAQFNVATMEADPTSLLHHYKKLIGARNATEALRKGYYLAATATASSVLAFARVYEQEGVVVVANVSGAAVGNLALSLPMSSLASGVYTVTDLYTGFAAGTVTLDASGGFSGWAPASTLGGNQTWVLRLTPQTTGLAAAQPAAELQLYPNPTAARVRVALTGLAGTAPQRLAVYDLSGRLLHTTTFAGPDYDLDTRELPAGAYFVKVTAGPRTAVQRLLVAR